MEIDELMEINQWDTKKKYNEDSLTTLIEIYKEIAEDYCNSIFDEEPAGVKKFIAYSINLNKNELLQSRSMGSVSYSYVTDIPDKIYKHLKPYRKMRW